MPVVDLGDGVEIDTLGATNTSTVAASALQINFTPTKLNSILFAGFHHNILASGGITTPAGWTLVNSVSWATGNRATYLYAKVATSLTAQSITATTPAATGFAGGVIQLSGVSIAPNISAATTFNLGTTVQAAAFVLVAGGGTGTTWNGPNPSREVIVSVCGATASLSAVSHGLIGYNYYYSDGTWFSMNGGAATSTSLAIGASCGYGPWDAGVSNRTVTWGNGSFVSRTQGIVSCMATPFAKNLISSGCGT